MRYKPSRLALSGAGDFKLDHYPRSGGCRLPSMKRLILGAALLGAGCSSNAPTTPSPSVPLCQSQNTADLTMTNSSPNNFTYSVTIDNILRGTIAPGQSLGPIALTAGQTHAIVSTVTNTGVIACSSTTSFAQCSTQTVTCRF